MTPKEQEIWQALDRIVNLECPNASPQVRAQYARGLYGSMLARLSQTDWFIRKEIHERLQRAERKHKR